MSTDDSYKMDYVSVRVPDLENLVEVLTLLQGKQQAEDIAKCHNNLVDVRYSPLTKEVGEVIARYDGYLKDYWAERGRTEAKAAAALEDEDDTEDLDEGESLDDLPPLPDKPFGTTKVSKAPPMVFEDDTEDDGDDPA